MRSRAASGSQANVSLFPFLAVLICTMGVMLLLLVLAVHVADEAERTASASASGSLAATWEEMRGELELTELKTAAVLDSRQQLQRELEQARARRGHIESELANLENRFLDLQRQFRDTSDPGQLDAAHLVEDAERIRGEIRQATVTLESLRREFTTRPKMYSIVPHRSIHGTDRRPIYLECLENEIVFQPAGIAVPAAELEPPILPGNPLDVALHAVRSYWLNLKLAGAEGSPYPLLVVRPGGARTYALARRAMQNWDDEFGYELIEQEKLLDFGEQDPTLTSHLRQTLQTARAQYAVLREAALHQQARAEMQQAAEGSGGLRASPQGGFIVAGSRQPAGKIRPRDDETATGTRGERLGNAAMNSSPAPTGPGGLVASQDAKTGTRDDPTADQPGRDSPLNLSAGLANRKQGGVPAEGGGEATTDSESTGPPASGKSLLTAAAPYSLAESRGANWAVPAYQPNATAYRRVVTIECGAEGLTLHPSTPEEARQSIPYDENLVGTTDQLVDALWTRIKGWGIAERNGYWLPELRFIVQAEGRARFDRLRILLADSGLDLTESPQ